MDPQTIADALVLVRDHRSRWHLGVLTRSFRIITAATALPRLPLPFPLHPALANLRVVVRKALSPRRRDQTHARLIHLDPLHDLAVLEPIHPRDLADVRPAMLAADPDHLARPFRVHVPARPLPRAYQRRLRRQLRRQGHSHPRPAGWEWHNGHTRIEAPAQPQLTVALDFPARHAQQFRGAPVFTNAGDIIGTVSRYPTDPGGHFLHAANLVAALPGWFLFTEHRAIANPLMPPAATPPPDPPQEDRTSVS